MPRKEQQHHFSISFSATTAALIALWINNINYYYFHLFWPPRDSRFAYDICLVNWNSCDPNGAASKSLKLDERRRKTLTHQLPVYDIYIVISLVCRCFGLTLFLFIYRFAKVH